LEYLDLAYTPVTSLPESIKELNKLTRLGISAPLASSPIVEDLKNKGVSVTDLPSQTIK